RCEVGGHEQPPLAGSGRVTPTASRRSAAETSAGTRMSRRVVHGDDRWVEIRIWLDHLDPPAGRLRRVGPPERRGGAVVEPAEVDFAGWLGLLRALDELIGRRGELPGGE
ncbi:MAG: hypothetical protein L0K86_12575, partial [Actinomycetia bacterium]|nr:hypothetical protein [Actinomycetes bacterium]